MLKHQGMTLAELLIVMVIIGFLSAMAVPAYQKYVHRAERHRAQSDLYKLQIWLEQEFTYQASYPTKINCSTCQLSEAYDFAVTIKEDYSGYQITAVPKLNSWQHNDECYTQALDNLSIQTNYDKNGNIITGKQCWK